MVEPAPGEPRDHMNALLSLLVPFARDTIGEHGEFLPFGATMLPDGEEARGALCDHAVDIEADAHVSRSAGRAAEGEGVVHAAFVDERQHPERGIRQKSKDCDSKRTYEQTPDAHSAGQPHG